MIRSLHRADFRVEHSLLLYAYHLQIRFLLVLQRVLRLLLMACRATQLRTPSVGWDMARTKIYLLLLLNDIPVLGLVRGEVFWANRADASDVRVVGLDSDSVEVFLDIC